MGSCKSELRALHDCGVMSNRHACWPDVWGNVLHWPEWSFCPGVTVQGKEGTLLCSLVATDKASAQAPSGDLIHTMTQH